MNNCLCFQCKYAHESTTGTLQPKKKEAVPMCSERVEIKGKKERVIECDKFVLFTPPK